MYEVNIGDNNISIIHTNNTVVVSQILVEVINATSLIPKDIAYDPINERIYMINSHNFANSVTIIDTASNTVIDSPISVAGRPTKITYDPVRKNICD